MYQTGFSKQDKRNKNNRRMNRRYCILTFLLAFAVAAFAQTAEEQKKKINSIKKDKAYLYAEITTDNQQSALDLAEDMLNQEINKYVAEQKKLRSAQNILLRNTQEIMESISLPRGNMFRAFKFVKKSDIMAADNAEVRVNTQPADTQGNKASGATTLKSSVQTVTTESAKRNETIARLLAVSKFADLSAVFKQLKQEGRIGQYAKIKELTNPEQFVLVIYNREGNIEAVLSEGSARTNLRTGQADNVSNYPGRGAIGVKVNN